MPLPWLIQLIIGVGLQILGYLLMPKPKAQKPAAAKTMDNPVAEAGKPIPVLFGTDTIKELNFLWYGQKSLREYDKSESSGGKK